MDIQSEFHRLFTLIQLCKLSDILCISCITPNDFKVLSTIASQLLRAGTNSSNKVTDNCASSIFCKLKDIDKKYNVGEITKQEKLPDVETIGLLKGYWYKCSNDHIFCAGEPKGTEQTVKCPLCIDNTMETHCALTTGSQMDN